MKFYDNQLVMVDLSPKVALRQGMTPCARDIIKQTMVVDGGLVPFKPEQVEAWKARRKSIERWLEYKEVEVADIAMIDPLAQWFDTEVHSIMSVGKVFKSHLNFAAETDCVVRLRDDRMAILKFSTQAMFGGMIRWSRSWVMALAAQAKAIGEHGYIDPACISIVFDSCMPGPPIVREWSAADVFDGWLDFQSCLFHWIRMNGFYKGQS